MPPAGDSILGRLAGRKEDPFADMLIDASPARERGILVSDCAEEGEGHVVDENLVHG